MLHKHRAIFKERARLQLSHLTASGRSWQIPTAALCRIPMIAIIPVIIKQEEKPISNMR